MSGRCAAPRTISPLPSARRSSGALLVGLLSAAVFANLAANPKLSPEIQSQLDLDNITFITNDRLRTVMEATTATPAQVEEAVRVNTEARLRALKIGLLIMAGLALLTILPAGRLPNYLPGEMPDPSPSLRDEENTSAIMSRGRQRA